MAIRNMPLLFIAPRHDVYMPVALSQAPNEFDSSSPAIRRWIGL